MDVAFNASRHIPGAGSLFVLTAVRKLRKEGVEIFEDPIWRQVLSGTWISHDNSWDRIFCLLVSRVSSPVSWGAATVVDSSPVVVVGSSCK